ncbi:MAG: hypothetical protein IT537_18980 [Hyphomicrobiales bacterium]|nr:hypothetical protein [Hyphomicrobiales bacterium]
MLEPDVTLTDFALALECGAFAIWLARHHDTPAFVTLFAASAVAALLGGISHGFLPDETAWAARATWIASLAAIGIAAFACWVAGADLILPPAGRRVVTWLAAILLVAYLATIVWVSSSFSVAIAGYAPAMTFLLIAFAIAWHRRPTAAHLAGVASMVLSFVAAAVQELRLGLHPVYFSHSALYHLIQAIAFLLLFLAARATRPPGAMSDVAAR